MIRPARPGDEPALATLQRWLPEPSPSLLEPAAGAEVLVSTADGDSAEGPTAGDREARATPGGGSAAPPRTGPPVAYVLWLPGEPVYLAELVVAPAFRRQGRAWRLVAAMLGLLDPETRVTLQVAADNEAAQALYGDLGFEVVGRDPEAYESGPGLWLATVVENDG